jgi:hypothetical protein
MMVMRTWDEFAADLTAYVRKHWPTMHRGAVLMPFVNDTNLFALLFGNNLLPVWEKANAEAEAIRQHIRRHQIEDLGFGLSPDGLTWVLVVRVEKTLCETTLGQAFQREMVKFTLEEAVREAWWTVYGGDRQAAAVLQDETA